MSASNSSLEELSVGVLTLRQEAECIHMPDMMANGLWSISIGKGQRENYMSGLLCPVISSLALLIDMNKFAICFCNDHYAMGWAVGGPHTKNLEVVIRTALHVV